MRRSFQLLSTGSAPVNFCLESEVAEEEYGVCIKPLGNGKLRAKEPPGFLSQQWHIYLSMRSRHADKRSPSMTEQVRQVLRSRSHLWFTAGLSASVHTGAGTVSTHEVPSILTSLGYYTTEEDVVAHTHQVVQIATDTHRLCCFWPRSNSTLGQQLFDLQDDGEGSREIGLEDVLRLLESRKQHSAADTDDTDTVEAFVALGGKVSSMLTTSTALSH